ncbi:MAG: cupin domain-containing protein [Spirochaetaceae bacterium]
MRSKNIIDLANTKMEIDTSSVPQYVSNVSSIDSFDLGSKLLFFDIRELPPGNFSCPYHYHSDEEEVFVVIEGEALLRQNDKKELVKEGDLLFFKSGEEGAHQLYNHTDSPFKYLDLSTNRDYGFCGYPDSKKINIGNGHIYKEDDKVGYYDGEKDIPDFWK